MISVGVPVGPIRITGSPGRSIAQTSELPPISSTITDTRPRGGVGPGAGHRQPLHAQHGRARGLVEARGEHLEVLQAVELAGAERAGGGGRADHDLDDGGRQAVHRMDRGA